MWSFLVGVGIIFGPPILICAPLWRWGFTQTFAEILGFYHYDESTGRNKVGPIGRFFSILTMIACALVIVGSVFMIGYGCWALGNEVLYGN